MSQQCFSCGRVTPYGQPLQHFDTCDVAGIQADANAVSAAPIPQDDPLKDARFDVEEGIDGLVRIAGQKQHMIEVMRWLRDYRKQAAALAASEARLSEMREAYMEAQQEIVDCPILAVAELPAKWRAVAQCRDMTDATEVGMASTYTHCANELEALLPKGEGATS